MSHRPQTSQTVDPQIRREREKSFGALGCTFHLRKCQWSPSNIWLKKAGWVGGWWWWGVREEMGCLIEKQLDNSNSLKIDYNSLQTGRGWQERLIQGLKTQFIQVHKFDRITSMCFGHSAPQASPNGVLDPSPSSHWMVQHRAGGNVVHNSTAGPSFVLYFCCTLMIS